MWLRLIFKILAGIITILGLPFIFIGFWIGLGYHSVSYVFDMMKADKENKDKYRRM